jgi:hypothetical protein
MKTSPETDLRKVPDLKGRWCEVYCEGLRMARIMGFPTPRHVSVVFQAREGRHRLPSSAVVGVYWRRKVVSIVEWTRIRELPKVRGGDGR